VHLLPGSRRFRQAEKKQVVRAAGIEPTSTGWKPVAPPLSYARASGGQPPARDWRLTTDRFCFRGCQTQSGYAREWVRLSFDGRGLVGWLRRRKAAASGMDD